VPKFIPIESERLLSFILNDIEFVLKVAGIYLKPNYVIQQVAKGDIVVYMGSGINQCHVGLIRGIAKSVYQVRVLPPAGAIDDAKWITVHSADVVCILEHCKVKKLWRLFMEETNGRGCVVQTTIKITVDKEELITRRKNLEQVAEETDNAYSYHICEVKDV
jgi:hypothetical protein